MLRKYLKILKKIYFANRRTVNWGGFAQGGVKLDKFKNLNIFKRVTANPTNCCGF